MSNDLAELGIGGNGLKYYYNGEEDIPDLSTRESIIRNDTITKTIYDHISSNKRLFFMPIDINENNFNSYQLKIFGILMNGSKVEVNITGIDIFFDIGIPTGVDYNIFKKDLNLSLRDEKISYWITDIEAYPLHGFYTEKQTYLRVNTSTTGDRSKLLKIVKDQLLLSTFSNDTSNYYRKAARENKFSLSDWVSIEQYSYEHGPTKSSPLCEYIISVDKKNYKRLTDERVRSLPLIIKDRTIVMSWDIESYSDRKTGEVPSPEHNGDNAFMICVSVHWLHESDAITKICIVDKDTESDPRWTTIVCDTFINILKALAICWNHYKPDIYIGYNDSGYDWPFVMEKAIKFNLLPWMWERMSSVKYGRTISENIIKYNYNNKIKREIKINAEKDFYCQCPVVPGTVCIDALPCFMKLYPRLETTKYASLKFYLKDNNLPTKVDLPIPVLWKHYESGDPKFMREIAYYCIVDTVSVQRLFVKRSVVSDYREISTLAYVSLSDSHYYAGGMKVCNLLGAYAWTANILVNMKPKYYAKAEKYPGAYVFPPDKGITPNVDRLKNLLELEDKEAAIMAFARDRPVSCLDFASLYPSLIMTYNLSPEKILLSETDKDKWSDNYNLHDIDFNIGDKRIQAWSILHDNDSNKMGLFPTILLSLFNKRKEMKQKLKVLSDKKELYENIFNEGINKLIQRFECDIIELQKDVTFIPPGSTMDYERNLRNKRILFIQEQLKYVQEFNPNTLEQDYSNTCFELNCIDKKQNALKIYMNTFYGETGNHLSPFFLLQLAGGVTSAGQYNIKKVAEYVRNKGFFIKYGDSVMPYTPLTLKNGNTITVTTFDSIQGIWISYPEFKSEDLDRHNKEYFVPDNMQVWTHKGWSNINRIIRHYTTKKIYRILTHTGLIDVTEDHSLLDINGSIISPINCKIGTELLHSTPDTPSIINCVNVICKTQLEAQTHYIHSHKNMTIYTYGKQYILTPNTKPINPNAIKKIELLHNLYTGYVYDIETECGSFHAGIGNLIVKNTDSLYLACPNSHFRECDTKYIDRQYTKEEYFTAMVKITLRVMSEFEREINSYLKTDNGTDFLKMENEGCNYPCLFLGKKKYFGIKHVNEVNFKPKKLFIKGIEVIKQGKSGIEKEIGYNIMQHAVSLDNEKNIVDIVKEIIKESIQDGRWKFEDFIQTGAWKPTKNNIPIHQFMNRMAVLHANELKDNLKRLESRQEPNELKYKPLEPGERFSYVLIKNEILHNFQGKRMAIKVGDLMEYAHIAKEKNMQIDIAYYLIHYITSICARFISSDDQFMPPNPEPDEKKLDDYTIKMAKKMLEEYIRHLNGISKEDIIQQGKVCKQLFKDAVQVSVQHVPASVKYIMHGPLLKIAFEDDNLIIDILFKQSTKYASTLYTKYCKTFCKDLCTMHGINYENGSDLIDSSKSYNLYKKLQTSKYNNMTKLEYECRKNVSEMLPKLLGIITQYKTNILYIIDKLKNNTDVDISFEYDTLSEFINMWHFIVGIEFCKLQNASYHNYLDELKHKRLHMSKGPTKQEVNEIIKNAIKNI